MGEERGECEWGMKEVGCGVGVGVGVALIIHI